MTLQARLPEPLADPHPIEPLRRPFRAAITPPGSKSLTCRAYLLAALARGQSRVLRPLRSDDTDRLRTALATLGAASRWDADDLVFEGVDGRFPNGGEVNLGDGGAPTRFMMAAATLAAHPVLIDGGPRMRERPVSELADLLRRLGARITPLGAGGGLPVRVEPGEILRGGSLDVGTTASGQFVSALLLVGPWLKGGLSLRFTDQLTSRGYVAMTAAVLRAWDIECRFDACAARVEPAAPQGRTFAVAPDASSATYWINVAALRAGSHLRLPGLQCPSGQPDAAYGPMLERLGAIRRHEEPGALVVEGTGQGVLARAPIDMSEMPDAALSLATLAAAGRGAISIHGLRTLRVKESDRVAALATELGRLGCTVRAEEEAITVGPMAPGHLPVTIETYRDHRMAMAFAVLGLARGGLSIRDPGCVSKSYPGFWDDMDIIRSRQSSD